MKKFQVFLFVGFLLVLLLLTAFAEEDDRANLYNLGKVIVTPSGYEEVEVRYPGNITIIGSEDIKKTNVKCTYELLTKEPGIFVSDYTGVGKAVNVDMRGFGDTASRNVLVLVDGRRINEIDISSTDWRQIPIENIERIEILRGSGSVLYGDNASAGVINIITKKGEGKPKSYIVTEFGSYAYRKIYGGVDGSNSSVCYNLFFNKEETDGYRVNGDYEGEDIQTNICLSPADYLDIDLSGGYHKDSYGLPGGLQISEIDEIGRRGATTSQDRTDTETNYIKLTPALNFNFNDMNHDIVGNVWIRNRWVDSTIHYVNYLDEEGPLIEQEDTSKIYSVGTSLKYINTYNFKDLVNKVTLGFDIFNANNKLETDTPALGTHSHLKIFKDTNSVFINDKIVLFDKITLNGGYRRESVYYTFDQPDKDSYKQKNEKEDAYDIGLNFKYAENGAVYGRFSKSYRFPATDEFYSTWTGLTTDLKHQKSKTYEIGIKDSNFKYFQPRINLFWMDTKDEIFYDPSEGIFGENNNYDEIAREGLELQLISKPFNYLELHLTYTYIDAQLEGGIFKNKRVPMVPKDKATFSLNIAPAENIVINYNARYIGSQYPINDQYNRQSKLRSYFVNDVKFTLKYKDWKGFLEINNIFNEKYSDIAVANVSGTVVDYYPSPERNYVFGLSKKF